MIHPEWRSRRPSSIPRTLVDVLREEGRVAVRVGRGSLRGGVGSVSRVATAEEQNWGQIVAKQNVLQRQPVRKKARPELLFESDGRIECDVEVMEGYKDNNLGVILRFTEIEFTKGSVQTSKHSRPDNPVFYIPVGHNERMIRLFLATRGDIFEIQIAAQMDVQPLFLQQELYLPQLTTTHDSGSMYVAQNNGIVTVGYNPRAY